MMSDEPYAIGQSANFPPEWRPPCKVSVAVRKCLETSTSDTLNLAPRTHGDQDAPVPSSALLKRKSALTLGGPKGGIPSPVFSGLSPPVLPRQEMVRRYTF